MLKKIFLFFIIFFINNLSAVEIIDNISREDKKFDPWTVSCEEDVMMDKVSCKIFSIFYQDNSSIFIQPNNKVANQVVIIIPSVLENTDVKVKIDKHEIITSDLITKKDTYGVIPFSPQKQKLMLSQLKTGQELFIRFTIRDLQVAGGIKEMTAKIGLVDFPKVLVYYDIKTGGRQNY